MYSQLQVGGEDFVDNPLVPATAVVVAPAVVDGSAVTNEAAPAANSAPEEGLITVKILSQAGKQMSTQVESLDSSVAELKAKVEKISDVSPELQRLIFMGRVLSDDQSLAACKIEDGSTVHLFARIKPAPVVDAPVSTGAPGAAVASLAPRRFDDAMISIHQSADPAERAAAIRTTHHIIMNRRVKLWSALLMVWNVMLLFQTVIAVAQPNLDDDNGLGQGNYQPEVPPNNDLENMLELAYQMAGAYVGMIGYRAAQLNNFELATKYSRLWIVYAVLFVAFNVSKVARAQGTMTHTSGEFMSLAARWVLIPIMMWSYCIVQAARFRQMTGESNQ